MCSSSESMWQHQFINSSDVVSNENGISWLKRCQNLIDNGNPPKWFLQLPEGMVVWDHPSPGAINYVHPTHLVLYHSVNRLIEKDQNKKEIDSRYGSTDWGVIGRGGGGGAKMTIA